MCVRNDEFFMTCHVLGDLFKKLKLKRKTNNFFVKINVFVK